MEIEEASRCARRQWHATQLALIAAGLRHFCRFLLLVADMRILPVSKLDQILRSSRPLIRGRTSCNEVIGNLKTFLSARYHKGFPGSRERGYSLVSDIQVGVSQAGVWKVLILPGRRFMVTIAGAPNWTGLSLTQVLHHGGFTSLFQIWRALRLKEFDSVY